MCPTLFHAWFLNTCSEVSDEFIGGVLGGVDYGAPKRGSR